MAKSVKARTSLLGPSPPPDFRAARLEGEGRSFLIMSYELPEWELPGKLTDAEQQVLRASLGGMSNARVAEERAVSISTIANQLASIFRKLGVGSRIELSARLVRPSRVAAEAPEQNAADEYRLRKP